MEGKAAAKPKKKAMPPSPIRRCVDHGFVHVDDVPQHRAVLDEPSLAICDEGAQDWFQKESRSTCQQSVVRVGDVERPHPRWLVEVAAVLRLSHGFLGQEMQYAGVELRVLLIQLRLRRVRR